MSFEIPGCTSRDDWRRDSEELIFNYFFAKESDITSKRDIFIEWFPQLLDVFALLIIYEISRSELFSLCSCSLLKLILSDYCEESGSNS